MRPCFAFTAASTAGGPEELNLLDEIGFWGTQAKDFAAALKAVKSPILNLNISSPGGDVFAGLAMYNMLRASGKEIHAKVVGIAASAASVVFMAGDKRIMPKNTMVMVHNPWTVTAGNAGELRDTADTLDKISNSILGVYVSRSGGDEAEMKTMLSKDTYLTADESLAAGFATEVTEDIKVQAKFDLARADLPENVKIVLGLAVAAKTPEQIKADEVVLLAAHPLATQISALAEADGLTEYAAAFAVSCETIELAKARISAAREIKALCTFAKKPDAAAALIKANKTVVEARAELVTAMAEADESIDTTPAVKNKSAGGSKQISPDTIWASHRKQTVKKGN